MKKPYKKYYYKSSYKNLILNHISANIHSYIVIITIFIIGICIGVTIVNNLPEEQVENTRKYISTSIDVLKNEGENSHNKILKESLIKNIFIVITIWLVGLTLFGNFLLYIIILILGISFGYMVSLITTTFTLIQGILFFSSTMLLQNIISIPAIFFMTVQGLKFRRELIQNNSNIKYITVKYSFYCMVVTILLFLSSIIEAYVSTNLINGVAKYL